MPHSIIVDGVEYWPRPKDKDASEAAEPLKFDSPEIRAKAPNEYKYSPLPQNEKMIRLLKLRSGGHSDLSIYCEFMVVRYDKRFHIPTTMPAVRDTPKVKADEKDDRKIDYLKMHEPKTEEADEDKKLRLERQAQRRLEMQARELNMTPEKAQDLKERKLDELVGEWKNVTDHEVKYEALSWTWGTGAAEYAILITEDGVTYRMKVRKGLAFALRYLREQGFERVMWIDAICIDQNDLNERNHQVQMMSRIHSRAQRVCVWLGEGDSDSRIAIKFIRDDIMHIKNFDIISTKKEYSDRWQALMKLMQRDWFSRRWVIQELALARAATVYCGVDSIPWKSFAVAVELFVEAETATHRLSEVMGLVEKNKLVPGFFEHVSHLGASLLVQATGKVFRTRRNPLQQDDDSTHKKRADKEKADKEKEQDDEHTRQTLRETQTIDPLQRRSLLSLEYLATTMLTFQASEPRDVVYSLLAIARDASPFAPSQYGEDDRKLFLVMSLLDRFLAEKPFEVDYSRPYSDVSRDFVQFCIGQKHKTDGTQALDILCRPWALEAPREKSGRLRGTPTAKRWLLPKRGEYDWYLRKLTVEKNPGWTQGGREPQYRYVPDEVNNLVKYPWESDQRSTKTYMAAANTKKEWKCVEHDKEVGWKPSEGWEAIKARYFPAEREEDRDIELPTWVARASQAPYMLDNAAGMQAKKTSRANADPLVGPPQDGHRNYNAAGREMLDLECLKFKKRPVLGHYSLYVKGFELDVVKTVDAASQLGNIPISWLTLAGWTDWTSHDPPDEFWRTIVADRGRDNRNPPYYYARACQESVSKGGYLGGSVDTKALIQSQQNSIVAEFCRRVQAVIWNRSLFKTESGRLGLASNVREGDKVCVLYGLTVPVILRQHQKRGRDSEKPNEKSELELEEEEDRVEILKAVIRRAVANRERRGKYWRGEKITDKTRRERLVDAMIECRDDKISAREDDLKLAAIPAERRELAIRKKAFELKLAKTIADADKAKEDADEAKKVADEAKKEAEKALEGVRAKEKTAERESKGADPTGKNGAAYQEAKMALNEATSRAEAATKRAQEAQLHAQKTKDAAIAKAARAAIRAAFPKRPEAAELDASQTTETTTSGETGNNTEEPPKDGASEDPATQQTLVETTDEAEATDGEEDFKDAEQEGKDPGTVGNQGKPAPHKTATPDPYADSDSEDTSSTSGGGGPTPGGPSTATSTRGSMPEATRGAECFYYDFVGECYLHGMMDGEAMREKFYDHDDTKSEKTFELR